MLCRLDAMPTLTDSSSALSSASPGQQAGLQQGDVITAVNGTAVGNNNDLASALQNQGPGKQVTLTVVRGTSTLTIKVTLGERPATTQG